VKDASSITGTAPALRGGASSEGAKAPVLGLCLALAALAACAEESSPGDVMDPIGSAGMAAAGATGAAGSAGAAGSTMSGGSGTTGGASGTAGTSSGDSGTSGGGAGADGNAGSAGSEPMAGAGGGDDGPVFTPTGEPLSAPDMTWTWVPFPDTQCRDGSAAGIGVSLNSASDKVMIFLQGGGACFDSLTCAGNPTNVSTMMGEQTGGLFARGQAENPVKDWNHVFVPYCTGDVHLGTNPDGAIEGVDGVQRFVGRLNLEKFLHRIVPTFPNATQVLLTGISAGGFGAAANTEFVQWTFGDIPLTVIDDSGPPMSTEYLPECLQEKWRTTWGFEDSILEDCGDDCPNPNDYSIPFTLHIANKFPDRMGGLIETTGDSVISLFYGYGSGECTGSFLTPLSEATFSAGLLDYRATIQGIDAKLGTYFITGTQHTWLAGGAIYTHTTGGVRMIDWITDIIEGTAAAHVGP
jgi:hypothetical protein